MSTIPNHGMGIPPWLMPWSRPFSPISCIHPIDNVHFYDPISKTLFPSDVGVSMVNEHPERPIRNVDWHYMESNNICRLWATMVKSMDGDTRQIPQLVRDDQMWYRQRDQAELHRALGLSA